MMRAVLGITCQPELRETVTSFASRLAQANGVHGAISFCRDMGINWSALVRGEVQEITKLATLAGANPKPLQRFSFRCVGRNRVAIGREVANHFTTRRNQARYCPVCLTDGMQALGTVGVFRRLDWQFSTIWSCDIHEVALVSAGAFSVGVNQYDLADFVRSNRSRVERTCEEIRYLKPTELEVYVRARLSGDRPRDWLGKMTLPVVTAASELLGIREIHGPKPGPSHVPLDVLRQAGEVGYRMLAGGEEAFQHSLCRFKSGNNTYNRDIGGLFRWVSNGLKIRPRRQIKNALIAHIERNYVITPGAIVLGRRIDDPKFRSLSTAEKVLGIRQERLSDILFKVSPHREKRNACLSKAEINRLSEILSNLLTLESAATRLGCSNRLIENLLAAGVLERIDIGTKRKYVSETSVSRLLNRICELPLASENGELRGAKVYSSGRRFRMTVICQLLLTGKLPSARRFHGVAGIWSVLVDESEVKRALSVGG